MTKNNMRQIIFKDLFNTAMQQVKSIAWRGSIQTGGWAGSRKAARTYARKIAREELKTELGNN